MSAARLRLFICGGASSSLRAGENLAALRQGVLPEDWAVEVVDVLHEPGIAESEGILATPTLALELGARSRRIVGDLSDTEKVLNFLGLASGSTSV